jgi:hypothetical protein
MCGNEAASSQDLIDYATRSFSGRLRLNPSDSIHEATAFGLTPKNYATPPTLDILRPERPSAATILSRARDAQGLPFE